MQPIDNIITAIDVGTTKVCTIVARKVNGQKPEIIAYSNVPCSCLLYTSPSPRDGLLSRMPSSA